MGSMGTDGEVTFQCSCTVMETSVEGFNRPLGLSQMKISNGKWISRAGRRCAFEVVCLPGTCEMPGFMAAPEKNRRVTYPTPMEEGQG